jgi:transcriptional regulator with XRE-family HTH domain
MTTVEIPPAKQKGDLLSAIGDTLRAERTEKGLTLKQVAEGAHVSVSYLAEIERGEKDPSSRVLESIARGLDVEISELLMRIASSLEPAPVVPGANSLAA